MKYFVWALFIALVILHHDVWWWERHEPFVFGFIPVGLAHHVGISLMAVVTWALAIRFCWPSHLDELDAASEPEAEDA